MSAYLSLPTGDIALLGLITFAAGLVRGFSGFALSALVMATAVSILPPVQLIPILWFLEMTASLMMARGGFREAENRTAITLVAGNWVGWPVGLYLTTTLPVATSKTLALVVIVALAVLTLLRLRIPGLASMAGTVIAGFVAGVESGLAHVGGMVVALYVLARGSAAASMRGTLVVYLFLASLGSFFVQLWFGVMDGSAALRGLSLAAPTALGVWLGARLFIPRWQPYYRPFCLWLLIGLACVSLIRHLG